MHVVRSIALSLTAATAMGVAPAASAAPHLLITEASAGVSAGAAAPASAGTDLQRLRTRLLAVVEATTREISDKRQMIARSDLTDEQKYAEEMGTEHDQLGLSALEGSAAGATTIEQLRGYAGDLRLFYPHVYDVAVSYLQHYNLLDARITAYDAALVGLPEAYASRGMAANEAARTLLATGSTPADDAGSVYGRTRAAELRRAQAALAPVRRQLDVVRAVLVEAHRFSRLQNRVLRDASAKLTQLSQAAYDVTISGLPDDEVEALSVAVEHDEHALSDLLNTVSATTSLEDLQPLAAEVARYHPHNVGVVLTTELEAVRLDAIVARNGAALAAVTDRDVSRGVAANLVAAAAVAEARSAAGDLTALSDRSDLAAVRQPLRLAHEQLRIVRHVLAGA